MNLKTIRFLTGKSQYDVEAGTGIFQTLLSRYEKSGLDCLSDKDKKKINRYLGIKVDWSTRPEETNSLTREELKELKLFVDLLISFKGKKQVYNHLQQYASGRKVYNAMIEFYANNTFPVAQPEMEW